MASGLNGVGFCARSKRRVSAAASRAARSSSVSEYKFCARLAETRWRCRPRTVKTKTSSYRSTRSRSPGLIFFPAFLQGLSLSRIFPPVMACAARLRVLKNRAAHNQVSMRCSVSASGAVLVFMQSLKTRERIRSDVVVGADAKRVG